MSSDMRNRTGHGGIKTQMAKRVSYPFLTAQEAVSYIKNGDTVALSGFTPAGAAKAIPAALANRGRGGTR